jgi:glycosyltransferase involved in cell wall biosynthesis
VIDTICVVVPAHDEEAVLPACLAALLSAARRVQRASVHICVVADACSDRTVEKARLAGVPVLEVRKRCVGAARSAGLAWLLGALQPIRAEATWLATTDADSTVPVHWLTRQIEYAEAGSDAVAGTVTVTDWTGHPPHLPGLFADRYATPGPYHRHVHGANLGVRASAYLAAGGFRPLQTAEDHALLRALAATGASALHVQDIAVETSSRRVSRAPHGFSHLLRRLAAQVQE